MVSDFSSSSCLHVGKFPIFFFPWDRLKVPGSFFWAIWLPAWAKETGGCSNSAARQVQKPTASFQRGSRWKFTRTWRKQHPGFVFKEKYALQYDLRFSNSDFPMAAPRPRLKQVEPRDKNTTPRGPLSPHPDLRFHLTRDDAGPGGTSKATALGGELKAKDGI